ncbi:hypothetical protein DRH27_02985 [Candidatus Falkowbacteria bacterium]|nr:MAG: hypothetical protein DRH27_02985 [Candidatus Falkowbacteria bacterium]
MFKESIQKIFKGEEPKKEEKPDAQVIQADDYRKEFTPANEARLRELRIKQNSLKSGTFSEADSKELLRLAAKKESLENKSLTEEEEQEYLQLSRDNTDNNNWTPKKSARFFELDKRREKTRKN